MATALSLEQYLRDNGASYEVLPHEPTMSATRTAEACHVSAERLAKAVVLKYDGGYVLAVLPASHHLELDELRTRLNRPFALASEEEIARLFPDCERGAVPPIGAAYGIITIMDDSIAEQPDIYFEGGDHATLLHMSGQTFARLMAGTPHGRISSHD
jgi:Ala-tRNA(Pro) deacylase